MIDNLHITEMPLIFINISMRYYKYFTNFTVA